MSAQSIAKAAQGYQPKPVPSTCGNCAHFQSDMELPEWCAKENEILNDADEPPFFTTASHGVEKNLRCTVGGFAVKKMATCAVFAMKVLP